MDVPLVQYIDTIVDVPVVKRCQALIRLGIRDDASLEKFVLRFERGVPTITKDDDVGNIEG